LSALFDQLWPYALMCAIAFSAGTLLPFSSEVALVAQMKTGLGSPVGLLLAATIGNVAGSCFNWLIGRYARHFEGRRWFPFSAATIDTASARFNALGVWTLLLAWVPIIGDPLTFVAGVMRVPFWIFLPLVTIGKAGRYAALAYGLS
jgi:membrane protein YqaA with SNARE-associated domain